MVATNIQPINSSELAKIKEKLSPFLKEIRKRIIFTVSVFVVATIIGFIFYERIIKFLLSLLPLEGINIVFTSPFQFINLAISCGIVTGLVVALPLLVIQILSFLKPALKRKEFKRITKLLPFSVLLFLIGFVFGALIMKWQIEVFQAKSAQLGIGSMLDISKLLSTFLLISTLTGISFQFPILLLCLIRFGLVSRQELGRKRLWIYLGSFFFAILLPVDSILADILLSLPLIVLFELTLLLSWISKRG